MVSLKRTMKIDKVVGELNKLGLSTYEARVYFALLGRSSFTAGEVVKVSGVPRQRVYDVLLSLHRKGFCIFKPGKVQRFSAGKPDIAIRNLFKQKREGIEEELKGWREVAEGIGKVLTPVFERGSRENNNLEYIEILKDINQIGVRFKELQAEARHEIIGFMKPPYAVSQKENVDAETALLGRKMRIRGVYEKEDSKEFWEYLRKGVLAGEEARIVDKLPMKFVVFDNCKVLYALEDPSDGSKPSYTYFVVEHPALAFVFKKTFEKVWEEAEPVKIKRDEG